MQSAFKNKKKNEHGNDHFEPQGSRFLCQNDHFRKLFAHFGDGPKPLMTRARSAGTPGSCVGLPVNYTVVGGSRRVLAGLVAPIDGNRHKPPEVMGCLRCINSINAVPPVTPPNPSIHR